MYIEDNCVKVKETVSAFDLQEEIDKAAKGGYTETNPAIITIPEGGYTYNGDGYKPTVGKTAVDSYLKETDFAEKTCIIMGSEGHGISHLLEQQCDSIVSIPTCGKIDSLNVSVAAGVLLYEAYRQKLEN